MDVESFDGLASDGARLIANARDVTYQPKICDPLWFCSESETDPKASGKCVLSQADYLFYQKKWDKAISLYKKAIPDEIDGIRLSPLTARITLESISRCYLHKGDTECALEWAGKLLKHSQSSEHKVVAHDLLSRIYKEAGDVSEEAEHLICCLLRQPLNGFHWMRLGHCYACEAQKLAQSQFRGLNIVKLESYQSEGEPSASLNSLNPIIPDGTIRGNEENVRVQERLETDLEKLKLNNMPSVNHSKVVIKNSIGKSVNGKIEEENDHNFERIQSHGRVQEASVQSKSEKLEFVDSYVNGSEHCLNLRERFEEGSSMDENKFLDTKEEDRVDLKKKHQGSSIGHWSSNSCDVIQGEEPEMDLKKFALMCFIRARMLFKPPVQSRASLCNIRNNKFLEEVEQSIQHLGFAKDYISEVENLCWKRQFGTGKGEDLEKTLRSADTSQDGWKRNFENYWFTSILNQGACSMKE